MSTVTPPRPVIRPCRRAKCPSLPVNRSTATLSSQAVVASSRIRAATGTQSGSTLALPAVPGIRMPSASRLAARIIIFDGTHSSPARQHLPGVSARTPGRAGSVEGLGITAGEDYFRAAARRLSESGYTALKELP